MTESLERQPKYICKAKGCPSKYIALTKDEILFHMFNSHVLTLRGSSS